MEPQRGGLATAVRPAHPPESGTRKPPPTDTLPASGFDDDRRAVALDLVTDTFSLPALPVVDAPPAAEPEEEGCMTTTVVAGAPEERVAPEAPEPPSCV